EDSFTGRIPRDHFCEFVEPIGALPATLCMIGGKWTTFRSFGALAADMALERLGLTREIGTEELAIGGGRDFPADTATWCAALASEYKI
ncbi:glycerol-3-phosphate dehydrogenase, partial [Klebsiella variicola]